MTAKGPSTFVGPPGSQRWETPRDLFDALHAEFRFTVDAASSRENAVLPSRFDDGLSESWAGHRVFLNPPFAASKAWTKKAARREADVAVLVVPAHVNTTWWRDSVVPAASEARFVDGRVHFALNGEPGPTGCPTPIVVLVYRREPRDGGMRSVWCWTWPGRVNGKGTAQERIAHIIDRSVLEGRR